MKTKTQIVIELPDHVADVDLGEGHGTSPYHSSSVIP